MAIVSADQEQRIKLIAIPELQLILRQNVLLAGEIAHRANPRDLVSTITGHLMTGQVCEDRKGFFQYLKGLRDKRIQTPIRLRHAGSKPVAIGGWKWLGKTFIHLGIVSTSFEATLAIQRQLNSETVFNCREQSPHKE